MEKLLIIRCPFSFEFSSSCPPLASFGWVAIALLTGPLSWVILAILYAKTDFGIYIVMTYLFWMYLDRKSCVNNDRRWKWLSSLSWWGRHRDYFPIKLVKTSSLNPDRNYLFAVFPHGIFTFGAMTSFTTDALDFREKFPGLTLSFCTLNVVFRLPVLREFALGLGFNSVSEGSLNKMLDNSHKGRAVAVAVGGAAEALISKPYQYKILLNKRKGFCRVALKNGCDIVPVYSFGESDVYDQYGAKEGFMLDKFQKWFKKITTVGPVVFHGEGLLGLFPRKVPITVTVGKPIAVKKIENPSEKDIEELHERFKEGIKALFDDHKRDFLTNKEAELMIC